MATIVCHQGLQSCLESRPVEPRALRLTLSSTRPLESASKSCSVKPEPGSWSVIEALFSSPKLSNEIEGKERVYVHPLEKRSLSALNDKSLELCTENLGSETGSDDILEDDILSVSSSSNQGNENLPTWKQLRGQKAIGGDFPPPLTTISGSESIRVRSHRENGRLVIKAENFPSGNSIFQAERSNGRLRLYSTSIIDYEEETLDHENDINDNNKEEKKFENDAIYMTEEEGGERAETTTFRRRDGSVGGGGRWEGGEHGGFLGGGYIPSFIVDLPV